MKKNKFKKLAGLLLAAVMALAALPIQTLASEWGKGDSVYAAMLGDYVGSDGKSYGDKRNYTFMYYKSDGNEDTSTRYASTHAKLGISKNGITQQAICIEAGVAYNTGSSYVGEDNSNTYLRNLPLQVRDDIKIALLCGFNSDTKSSPVSGTNLDDFSFATQIIVWEIQQQLRTGYNKSDLKANKWGTPAKVYYEQLQGRPAEKCYDYILGKMKAYSVVPSFTGRVKVTAPTHTLKYNSSTKKYSLTLTDEYNSGMPASAFNISGVTVTKSGNKYTFSTNSKISGTKSCSYKANRTSGDQLVIWKSSNGSQTMASGIDDPVQFYANFKTESTGTAQIKKVWLSDTTLTSAQIANLEKSVFFMVKDSDGKFIKVTGSAGAYVYAGTQTTANNLKLSGSKFNVSKLPMGTYTVTEINNASGYNPKTQTKTVTIANKGETKSVSFTNKSTPVVVIRKHFSDEDNLTEAQLKEQYAKVTVNLQVLGFSGSVSSNPPAGYYVEFTGSNGNYTYKGLSSTKTSATNLKLNENGEMTISFGTNTAPYYLAVIETYSGTDYDVDNRDQRIDLGNGDPNTVIDLDDIELDNQLKTGSVQVDKEFLNENGAVENITDEQLAEVSFKIMHNGKYLTFTGSNGSYTYKGENNTGTELKLNKATYNFIANELPAREEYTVYEVSGTTGYSFSIDPVTFTITPAGSVKKVFTNKAMTGTISIVKHSADGVLSGWQFRVTGTAKTGQSYDKTFTTDAKGTITISNIRIGDYKVTEVKTGKTVGYITENSKDLEVKTDTVTTVNFENKPYANIVINKVDAKTGEKVTGATFGIYTDSTCKTVAKAYKSDTDSTLVNAEIIETATGVYTCNNLPISSATGTTYYVKELTAPEGYYLDANAHAVTLKTANATVSVSNEIGKSDFKEYPYGHGAVIKEWKLDNGTADMTADEIAQMKAELEKSLYFTVKDSNGKYITATGADGVYTYNGESTTEFRYVLKNSTFTIAELPTGDYTITEYSTLLDYTIKSENPVKITVVRNQTATATFVNERDTGNASIIKKWTNPNGLTTAQKAELEKNVYFTVKNADGAYLKAVSKNGKYVYNGSQTAEARFMLTNGKFELTELPTGKYTITEINNAEGYLPKTQVKTITVTKDATASAEFVNKVIVGNVTLTKVDEDYPENKLTGAVFTVYKSDKKTVVGTLKETETGVYSLEGLVYGDYYVQETKAPEYFVRDVNFYYFQILNDGETVEVSNDELGKGTFINSPQKGEIKIVKTSYDNKVEGIHFEVTGKTYTGQTFKKTYTTDKNGIIRINDLRAGEYTIHEVKDSASAGYLLPDDKQLTIDRDGAMLVTEMHNSKIPDNPPTGASEDSFTQTAVIIISMVMMSAAVVLVFPLSKRKRKR